MKSYGAYDEMQTGDVPVTWADASLLKGLTGIQPQTGIKHGIEQFAPWFRGYYAV